MPRHRIERAPLYRTLWTSAGQPASRVRQPHVPAHAREAESAFGQGMWRGQRQMLTGAARGLLVSPWFAAGAGFVIATGAVIYAPHAQLQFGGAIGVTECKLAGCNPVTAQGEPPLPVGFGAGPLISQSATPTVATGVAFHYRVLWQSRGRFAVEISVDAQHSIGPWQLAFVIPGATDISVAGAHWQPAGADGGTASGTTTGGGWSDAETGFAGSSSADRFQFSVFGTGKPGAPVDGRFNGASCRFTAS